MDPPEDPVELISGSLVAAALAGVQALAELAMDGAAVLVRAVGADPAQARVVEPVRGWVPVLVLGRALELAVEADLERDRVVVEPAPAQVQGAGQVSGAMQPSPPDQAAGVLRRRF
jgi:hypothetical protein